MSSKIDTTIYDHIKSDKTDLDTKFDKDDWTAAEKPGSIFDKSVYTCLKEHSKRVLKADGTIQETTKTTGISVLSDEFYNTARKLFKMCEATQFTKSPDPDVEFVEDQTPKQKETKPKKQPKPGMKQKKSDTKPVISKLDAIRMANSESKVRTNTVELLKQFIQLGDLFVPNFQSGYYLEHIGFSFMYCAFLIVRDRESGIRKFDDSEVYELIVGIQKFIGSLEGLTGKYVLDTRMISPASQLILDLEEYLGKIFAVFRFDGLELCRVNPKLVLFSKYDKFIPSDGLKPRPSQQLLVSTICDHVSEGFLLIYKATVASGKTTAAGVCIPEIVSYLNAQSRARFMTKRYELILCCNIRNVKNQLANVAFNSQVHFGIASMGPRGVRIVNQYNTTDETRDVVICTPESACALLKEEAERVRTEGGENKYWFFLDEPTIGADQMGSESLYNNIKTWEFMPPRTILSSATMCDLDNIEYMITEHLEKYPNIYVGTVGSQEIHIGCDVMTYERERVLPHAGCTTSAQLRMVIQTIRTNPFLCRMYTVQVAKDLYDCMVVNKVPNTPNLSRIFSDVNNLKTQKVFGLCMQMLELVAATSDAITSQVCKSKPFYGLGEDPAAPRPADSVDFTKLGTTQANMYTNMSLVVDVDPVNFALTNFSDLTSKAYELGVHSARELVGKYQAAKAALEKDIAKYEADTEIPKDEKSQKVQKMREEKMPKLGFPAVCQINSQEHVAFYAPEKVGKIGPTHNITPPDIIPFASCGVPDNIMLLLFCGVGIYCPSSKILDEEYNQLVLRLASTGSLAFVISDSSITYGTNYPFYRVIITMAFFKKSSMNSGFQLFGRTGRVGQSWSAEAFIDAETAVRLLDYVRNPNNVREQIEGKNMVMTYQIIQQKKEEERAKQEEKRREQEEEEARSSNRIRKMEFIIPESMKPTPEPEPEHEQELEPRYAPRVPRDGIIPLSQVRRNQPNAPRQDPSSYQRPRQEQHPRQEQSNSRRGQYSSSGRPVQSPNDSDSWRRG